MVLSYEPSVKSVREKGEALLELVQDIALKDKIDKLQSDYQDLCGAGKVRRDQKSNKTVLISQKGGPASFSSARKFLKGWYEYFSFYSDGHFKWRNDSLCFLCSW